MSERAESDRPVQEGQGGPRGDQGVGASGRPARALTDRLWRVLHGERLPPERWVEGGWPKLPALLALLAAPACLAGPVRAITHLPLWLSLLVGLALTAGVTWLFAPWLRQELARTRWASALLVEALALLPVAFAVWALFIRDFDGYPNSEGWDGGSHVHFKNRFVGPEPGTYHGFVALYAVVGALEAVLRLDAFRAFATAYYLSVIVYVALPVGLALVVVRGTAGDRRLPMVLGLLGALACHFAFLRHVGLPLVHYNQIAGFYANVFAIVPLLFVWAVDVAVRAEPLRLLGLGLGLVLMRYSYGLNLPDTIVAVAAVIVLGAPRLANRLPQTLLAFVLLGAAAFGYVQLAPRFDIFGGMARPNVDKILAVHLGIVLLAGLYLAIGLRAPAGPDAAAGPRWSFEPAWRALRLPLVYALASSVAFAVFRADAKQYYYYTKYQFATALLLSAACVVLAAHAMGGLPALVRGRRLPERWLGAALVLTTLVFAPLPWTTAFAYYRKTFAERMEAVGAPYVGLRPVADASAMRRIRKVLANKDKAFGGYLTNFFPMFSFMNASFGHHSGVQEFFAPNTAPGHCVFWVRPEHDLFPNGPVGVLEAHRQAVMAGDAGTCATYNVRWKTTPQSLCYRCY